MNCFRFAVFAFVLIFALPSQAAKHIESLGKKQVLADLNQLEKLLKRIHPNIYAHRKPAEINRRFKVIKAQVMPKMDIWTTAMLAQKMLASVCDEHTKVDYLSVLKQSDATKKRFFVFPMITTKDGLFRDNYNLGKKTEQVLSINGVSAEKIKQYILDLTSADGCPRNDTVFMRMQSLEAGLSLASFLKFPEDYIIEMKTKSDDKTNRLLMSPTKKTSLSGIAYTGLSLGVDEVLRSAGIDLPRDRLIKRIMNRSPVISTALSKDGELAYVQVRHFFGGKQQRDLTNKLLRKLIKAKPKQIILDLSENPGGEIDIAGHLMSYFLKRAHRFAKAVRVRDNRVPRGKDYEWVSAKRKTLTTKNLRNFRRVKRRNGQYTLKVRRRSFSNPSFSGKLTVLVSPLTRSAATMAALILKRKAGATIIGATAGGSARTACFAPNGYYRLKNSRLRVAIPQTCFDRDAQAKGNSGHLVSDIEIDPLASSSEYLLERTMKVALEYIQESR